MLAEAADDGAAMLEFALVTVLLLTIVVGILGFGLTLGAQQTVTHAASEAARSAIADPTPASVEQRVHDELGWLASRGSTITVAQPPCPGCATVAVTVTNPFSFSVVGPSPPETLTSTATVQLELED